jgi:soluble lytic murein transglycosylase-like protein
MRWILILVACGLIASGVLAQTSQFSNDPARPASPIAAIPAASTPTPADPLGPAGKGASPPVIASPQQSPADPPARPASLKAGHSANPSASSSLPGDPMRASREKQQAAMVRQFESVRKQAESAGAWIVPGRDVDPAPPGDPPDPPKPASSDVQAAKAPNDVQAASRAPCDPMGEASVAAIIDGAARAQSVQPKLLRAVIEQESRFHPCAVSPKGAKGMMQLMPDTAAELGVSDPFDPKENIEAGAKYIRQLLDRYKGDLAQALGAYNAGPGAVDQAGGIPNFRETRDYVQSIMQKVGTIPLDLPSIPMPKPIEN